MRTDTGEAAAPARELAREPFAWAFTTPVYVGVGLNLVNSSSPWSARASRSCC
ncbi:hypothetical protein [Streptomyces sp. NPDC101776]|uniref:hypothetical protein n=1 Tax=Streptomyces sp. NPDC101776 TaxID=3366146 RepID=UPI00382913AF